MMSSSRLKVPSWLSLFPRSCLTTSSLVLVLLLFSWLLNLRDTWLEPPSSSTLLQSTSLFLLPFSFWLLLYLSVVSLIALFSFVLPFPIASVSSPLINEFSQLVLFYIRQSRITYTSIQVRDF